LQNTLYAGLESQNILTNARMRPVPGPTNTMRLTNLLIHIVLDTVAEFEVKHSPIFRVRLFVTPWCPWCSGTQYATT